MPQLMWTRFLSRILGLLVFILGVFALPSVPEGHAAEIGFIDAIQQRGYLRVGLPPYDTPPAYYIDPESQQLVGFDVDLARGLAKALDVELRFDRESSSFNELVARVGRDEFDMAIGKLGQTYSRLANAFPIQYLHLRHALLADRQFIASLGVDPDDPDFGNALMKSSMRIGSIENSTWEVGVDMYFPNANFVAFSDWSSSQSALLISEPAISQNSSIDAIYRDATEIKKIVYDNPALTLDYVPVILDDIFEECSIYFSESGYRAFSAFVPFYLDNSWGSIKDDQELIQEYNAYYYPAS